MKDKVKLNKAERDKAKAERAIVKEFIDSYCCPFSHGATIFNHYYGEKEWLRKPQKKNVENYFSGLSDWKPSPLSQKSLLRANNDPDFTAYFAPNPSAKRIPVIIDIDIMKKGGIGSKAGACDLASHFDDLFELKTGKILYREFSPSGKGGIHQLFWIEGHPNNAKLINDKLEQFDNFVKTEGYYYDIEQVEITERCTELSFREGRGRFFIDGKHHSFEKAKMGGLISIPKNLIRDRMEIADAPVIQWQDLDKFFAIDKKLSINPPAKKAGGSLEFSGLKKSLLKKLDDPAIMGFAAKFLKNNPLVCANTKHTITEREIVVSLLLLFQATKLNKKANGQCFISSKLIEAGWTMLRENGYIKSAFHESNWKIIRDKFMKVGIIKMIDNSYYFYGVDVLTGNGERKKGKCMQLCLADSLINIISLSIMPQLIEVELSILSAGDYFKWLPRLIYPEDSVERYLHDPELVMLKILEIEELKKAS